MKIGECFLEVKDGEVIVSNGDRKSVAISEHEVWKQLDGLLRKESELEDIKGQKFGDFTAIERTRVYPSELWLCKCEAGHQFQLSPSRLRKRANDKYGGCWHCRNIKKGNNLTTKKDDQLTTKKDDQLTTKKDDHYRSTYQAWHNLRSRCLKPEHRLYKHYGGRGITVCEEWKNDFKAFYTYVSSLEHYGEPGRSIDRIDNDKGCFPGNVRWATAKEQANNQRHRKKKS